MPSPRIHCTISAKGDPALFSRTIVLTLLQLARLPAFILFFTLTVVAVPLYAETTVLVLGDSLTAGYGIEKQDAFPALLETLLEEKGYHDVKVINGGFSGSTTASAIKRMKWYERIQLDILILELGANDGLRGNKIDTIRQNLAETIQYALGRDMKVLLAGMQIPTNYGQKYTREFKSIFPDLANRFSISLIPFLLKDVAGKPSLNLPDGIHPNAEGHKIIAQTVLEYLMPLLE